jgi:hypothetical protein
MDKLQIFKEGLYTILDPVRGNIPDQAIFNIEKGIANYINKFELIDNIVYIVYQENCFGGNLKYIQTKDSKVKCSPEDVIKAIRISNILGDNYLDDLKLLYVNDNNYEKVLYMLIRHPMPKFITNVIPYSVTGGSYEPSHFLKPKRLSWYFDLVIKNSPREKVKDKEILQEELHNPKENTVKIAYYKLVSRSISGPSIFDNEGENPKVYQTKSVYTTRSYFIHLPEKVEISYPKEKIEVHGNHKLNISKEKEVFDLIKKNFNTIAMQ